MTGTGTMAAAADAAPLAAARQLQAANPAWMVVYGTYSRQFTCFQLFGTARRVILVGSDPGLLPARMRDIEDAAGDPDPAVPAGAAAGGQSGWRG